MSYEVAGGVLQGAAAGSMYGPPGIGIGAVIGGIGALWNKSQTEKERADLLRQLAAAKKRDLKLSEKMKRNMGIEQQKVISQGLRDLADRQGGQTTRNAYGVARQGYDYVGGSMRQEQAELRERELEINRRYDQFIDPEGRAEQRGEAVGNAITAVGDIGAGLTEYYEERKKNEIPATGVKTTPLGSALSTPEKALLPALLPESSDRARKILEAKRNARKGMSANARQASKDRTPPPPRQVPATAKPAVAVKDPLKTSGATPKSSAALFPKGQSNVPKEGQTKVDANGIHYRFTNGAWREIKVSFS